MDKQILEEIYRIKEVMGLITEARIPDWLYELVAVSTGRSGTRDLLPSLKSRIMSRTTNFKKLAEDVEMYLKIQTTHHLILFQ